MLLHTGLADLRAHWANPKHGDRLMYAIPQLVINWHLTEACNYGCKYCYAAWAQPARRRELIHDFERVSALLRELYQFFRPGNPMNSLSNSLSWTSVRLNLAGGEPLLYSDKFLYVVDQARNLGFDISLICNGSKLKGEMLTLLPPQLTWLGISIDSVNPETNRAIGRVDRRGQLPNLDELASSVALARELNPALHIKLNTVVNNLNHSEDLSSLIQRLGPDKWKVLRMLPVVNQHLSICDEEFDAFVARHRKFDRILCVEDNRDMCESYLMIDPCGRFFQNRKMIVGQGYLYSRRILEVGAKAAFAEMNFDPQRFSARYTPTNTGVGG